MEMNLGNTTQTDMTNGVKNFSVAAQTLDEPSNVNIHWDSPNWTKYLGNYNQIPEFKQALVSLARWVAGRGYTTDAGTKVILDNIRGWGEDSVDAIFQNMQIIKKLNGDSFAEIIRDGKLNTLVNLKPLAPNNISIVVNPKGIIIRYDELNNKGNKTGKKFKPEEILHLSNDRIANQIHGDSIFDSVQWIIDAKNEAMRDWRRIEHRSTIRVMYIDADDTTRLTHVKTEYKDAINNGELMIIPAKKGEAEFQDVVVPPIDAFLRWMQYLDNIFYQAVGVPKIILGGSAEFTEASAKVGYLTFEQTYAAEQRLLEQDIWNQLGLRIEFERPVSLKENIQEDEAKNTGQLGIQPNETEVSVERTE